MQKTLQTVKRENKEINVLISAVINALGDMSYIEDVNKYGIDGGYGEFIYYSDTVAFAQKHHNQIRNLICEQSADFGMNEYEFIASFKCLDVDSDMKKDIYSFLGGKAPKEVSLANGLAWYAAEHVCRLFED